MVSCRFIDDREKISHFLCWVNDRRFCITPFLVELLEIRPALKDYLRIEWMGFSCRSRCTFEYFFVTVFHGRAFVSFKMHRRCDVSEDSFPRGLGSVLQVSRIG